MGHRDDDMGRVAEVRYLEVPVAFLPLQQRYEVVGNWRGEKSICYTGVLEKHAGTAEAELLTVTVDVMISWDAKDATRRHARCCGEVVEKLLDQHVLLSFARIGEVAAGQDEINRQFRPLALDVLTHRPENDVLRPCITLTHVDI